jgi:hypothetical protein
MITLLYGAAAVFAFWWLSKQFAKANPSAVARGLKTGGGILAIGAAVVLGVRGRMDMAIVLGMLGTSLLGWKAFGGLPGIPNFGRGKAPAPGSVSRVRSAMIEMELDHDTGDMSGSVLAGTFAGRRLGDLDQTALSQLYRDCAAADPEGVRLLEAYLDRRFAGWREHAQAYRDPGSDARPRPGVMTEQEAYEILGLQPGAAPDEIRGAHRSLMKKLHPDQGGSTYLAARVNEAKEVLLGRHR